jgi:hypothetical protein
MSMINVECPSCGTVATVPQSAAGHKGKCMNCGNVVQVPELVPKICAICESDVSFAQRVKDDAGAYYCMPCWQEHAKTLPPKLPPLKPGFARCTFCGFALEVEQLLHNGGKPACRQCFARQFAEAARTRQNRPTGPKKIACAVCRDKFTGDQMLNNHGNYICNSCYVAITGGHSPDPMRKKYLG